jgi:hypothetical protein
LAGSIDGDAGLQVRDSDGKPGAAPGGAQVAAEAMTYDRDRRTDCKAGRSRPRDVLLTRKTRPPV